MNELAHFYNGAYWSYTGRTSVYHGITNFYYETGSYSGTNIDSYRYTKTAYTIWLEGNNLTYTYTY